MALKRAKFLSYGDDAMCVETKEFIEKAGVILDVRDIGRDPLSVDEMKRLFGHIDIRHFVNPLSDAYSKFRLDSNLPPREKVMELMAEDHTLIRRPIIQTMRLVTVGCDRRKISEMLQISLNGSSRENDDYSEDNRRSRSDRERTAVSGK